MKVNTYLASECGAVLDSNVIHGGGTDDTAALQAILDRARDKAEGVRLIVDGAALIRGLKVYLYHGGVPWRGLRFLSHGSFRLRGGGKRKREALRRNRG